MAHGGSHPSMSQILSELGIDPEDVKWYHLAACKGMDLNWFYDTYEDNQYHAQATDEVCLNCPVIKQCYSEGVQNKERGVWGGVYLNLGRIDKQYNAHKTKEVWSRLKKLHGKNIL